MSGACYFIAMMDYAVRFNFAEYCYILGLVSFCIQKELISQYCHGEILMFSLSVHRFFK